MKKGLVIEGCFDLFHEDHRSFIDRCIEGFKGAYGQDPCIHVSVMSNQWTHGKGNHRPFMDTKGRMAVVKKYLATYEYDFTIREAAKASFEYVDEIEFDTTFKDTVIAISKENYPKVRFRHQKYLVIQPCNTFHTTDIENALFDIQNNSRCKVRKVGAVLMQRGSILSKSCNTCTCNQSDSCTACTEFLNGNIAKSRQLGCAGKHAEEAVLDEYTNASGNSDVVLLTTTAPCLSCAEKIVEKGITHVVYINEWHRLSEDQQSWYVDSSGVDFLLADNVHVRQAGL